MNYRRGSASRTRHFKGNTRHYYTELMKSTLTSVNPDTRPSDVIVTDGDGRVIKRINPVTRKVVWQAE